MSPALHFPAPRGISGTLQLPSAVRSIECRKTLFPGCPATTRISPEHAVDALPTRFVYAVILFGIASPPELPLT